MLRNIRDETKHSTLFYFQCYGFKYGISVLFGLQKPQHFPEINSSTNVLSDKSFQIGPLTQILMMKLY